MYTNFYQLSRIPFHITPDPEFLFLSPSHKQALASIIYGVEKRKGFVAVTGDVGLGKTTIIRSYLERVDREQLKVVYIFNPNVSFNDLLKSIYRELDLHTDRDDVYEMVNRLHEFLIEEYGKGGNVAIIIDDAQRMPVETLENLRMLSNLETSKDKLVQILLVGQPELEKILNLEELRQLKHRIAIRTTILPLTRKESMDYIQHRLARVAVYDPKIFTKGALMRIVKTSKGNPRIINILCENALITGFGYLRRPIDSEVVKEVIADFGEKKKVPVLQWALASLMVVLLFAGAWALPYKDRFLSAVKEWNLPQRTQTSSLQNESALFAKDDTQAPERVARSGSPFFGKVPSMDPAKPIESETAPAPSAGEPDTEIPNTRGDFRDMEPDRPGNPPQVPLTVTEKAEEMKSVGYPAVMDPSVPPEEAPDPSTEELEREPGENEPVTVERKKNPPVDSTTRAAYPGEVTVKEDPPVDSTVMESLQPMEQAEEPAEASTGGEASEPPRQADAAVRGLPPAEEATRMPAKEVRTSSGAPVVEKKKEPPRKIRDPLTASAEGPPLRRENNIIGEERIDKDFFIGEFPENRTLSEGGVSTEETPPIQEDETFRIIVGIMGLLPEFEHLSNVRQRALIDLARELSVPRLSKFTKMLEAIREEDFQRASDEMLNARWPRQKRPQIEKLAGMMRDNAE